MKRTILAALLGAIVLLPAASPAAAADHPVIRRHAAPGYVPLLPFPRSKRAQSVWASDSCWNHCGASCAWGLNACLYTDTQGNCLKLTDVCDRSCQRECRTWGGPLIPYVDF